MPNAPSIELPRIVREHSEAKCIVSVLRAALRAVDPELIVRSAMIREKEEIAIAGQTYDLNKLGRVCLLGAGKAAPQMAAKVCEILQTNVSDGIVIGKHGGEDLLSRLGPVELVRGAHPTPDATSVRAAKALWQRAEELGTTDLAVVLVAGGASALMTLPAPGLKLSDIRQTTDILMRAGAAITELNAVRKHLSRIKGGQLARLIAPAQTVALILSDVVGDALDAIGSGPTAADRTTFAEAISVLEHYGVYEEISPAVREHLTRGLNGIIPETPKSGDPLFKNVQNAIVGSNRLAVEAAVSKARELKWNARGMTDGLEGEARQAGIKLAIEARLLAGDRGPLIQPTCLVFGGETTVTVSGRGRGGRNQELALAAALELASLKEVLLVTLGTDGEDGPTDAAGAAVDGQTVRRARELGMDPHQYLQNNDSYSFFDRLGDLLKTGPTGTNVSDLAFVFAF